MADGDQAVQRTFFFTDVEGSTRLWERHPTAMPAALSAHDAAVKNAIEAHQGRIFKTVGDAVCAVFADERSAVLAAVAAQRALAGTDWRELGLDIALTVRIAIRSGDAEPAGDDFTGPVLNRLSRLLAAGHGEQTLLARPVAVTAADVLPEGIELRDLGERRLRDVPGTEHIHQVTIDGLTSSFPPLRTLDAIAHNLPVAPTACIGREVERQRLRALFPRSEARLVTLLGPGGIGKTRLALQMATDLLDEFPDGVWFVDLTAIRDAGLIAGAVGRALNLPEEPGRSPEEILLPWLRERQLLLVLDNCEQIVEGVADFAAGLLRASAGLRILTTSRAPLHIRVERQLPVGPLDVPASAGDVPLQDLGHVSSVQLFLERACDVSPTLTLGEHNAEDIVGVCRLVDGIPLAIELAAARAGSWPVSELRRRLDNRLQVLTDGMRDLPPRQRTMRAAIEWSYELLNQEEQALFRRVGVFAGLWTLPAATEILMRNDEAELDHQLSVLAGQSLLRQVPGEETTPSFQMLETIREFAIEQLDVCGEASRYRDRHADYFVGFAETAARAIGSGNAQRLWLDRLEMLHDNMREAGGWLIERRQADNALRLASALWYFRALRGYIEEGRLLLEQALSLPGASPSPTLGRALRTLGHFAIDAGTVFEAERFYTKSLEMAHACDDDYGIAAASVNLAMVANLLQRADDLALAQQALARCQAMEDDQAIVIATTNLAICLWDRGELEEAERLVLDAMQCQEARGDELGLAYSRCYLGHLHVHTKNPEEAEGLFDESLRIFTLAGDMAGIAEALYGKGIIALRSGDLTAADTAFTQALELRKSDDLRMSLAETLEALTSVREAEGDAAAAEAFRTQAGEWRRITGVPVPRRQMRDAVTADPSSP